MNISSLGLSVFVDICLLLVGIALAALSVLLLVIVVKLFCDWLHDRRAEKFMAAERERGALVSYLPDE